MIGAFVIDDPDAKEKHCTPMRTRHTIASKTAAMARLLLGK